MELHIMIYFAQSSSPFVNNCQY